MRFALLILVMSGKPPGVPEKIIPKTKGQNLPPSTEITLDINNRRDTWTGLDFTDKNRFYRY
jgi:hypothetical protein